MTTTQESPNGHRVAPPPSSAGNPAELHSANLPANEDNLSNNTSKSEIPDSPSPDRRSAFPAGAYHVPPGIFVPKSHAYRNDDHVDRPHLDGPLPDRCQFMFSDGRQCTMARSDIHPSLCFYHADREEQLFGDPSYRFETRKLDFPELFSACRDLTTAAGVNRALAQVFRLLAQRRISRQEAATFCNLAKLLLRTISLMAAESLAVAESDDVSGGVILSEQPPAKRDTPSSSSPRTQPLPASRNEVEPPPRGFVMKSNAESGTSPIFRRPATPVLNEDRFQLSGCTTSGPANQHLREPAPQLTQNEHLQNLRT